VSEPAVRVVTVVPLRVLCTVTGIATVDEKRLALSFLSAAVV
jgi:hypothetical protein